MPALTIMFLRGKDFAVSAMNPIEDFCFQIPSEIRCHYGFLETSLFYAVLSLSSSSSFPCHRYS